jgi:hypothetical protein
MAFALDPIEQIDGPVLGLSALRGTPGWSAAITRLRSAWEADGARAHERAVEIRSAFSGRRGLMVLDVVLSRQRQYTARVTPLLNGWIDSVHEQDGELTMGWLADHPTSCVGLPLRVGEADTIVGLAAALLRYGAEHQLGEDDACTSWAASARGLELAPKLDPYVGAVKGIGPALLAYTRMLCGADTIKPDVRVLKGLKRFGLQIAVSDAAAGFVAAVCVAYELGIPVIELDQLLWYSTEATGQPPT